MKNYYLKQKVFSIKDRYKIYDAAQNITHYCKSKAFRPGTLSLFDASEKKVVYTLRRKRLSLRPGYRVFDAKNKWAAEIKKRFALMQKKLTIKARDESYTIKGSHWARDFSIGNDQNTFVVVHKKRLAWGDTYEIGIDENSDQALMMAFVIMLDHLYHNKKTRNRRGKRRR